MTEHWIRLRGGWEWIDAGQPDASPRRIRLPLDPREGVAGRFQFARWFHAPPLDPASEEVVLHLSDVHGLCGVWLNDQPLASPLSPEEPVVLALDDLRSGRNRLVLEAQLAPPGGGGPAPESWGAIALVIRSRSGSSPPLDSIGGAGGGCIE